MIIIIKLLMLEDYNLNSEAILKGKEDAMLYFKNHQYPKLMAIKFYNIS